MISATEALERLKEGNRRFANGRSSSGPTADPARRSELATSGQSPFAVILGCSDSRVPVETVFDQGLGDLFVIRIAGNIVVPALAGSIEFAAERFGTRLVVVLGHSNCGAILATIDALGGPSDALSPNLRPIVDWIRPSVESVRGEERHSNPGTLAEQVVRANVLAAVNHLRNDSHVLKELIRHNGLEVIGAEYDLETGVVEFLDDDADTA